MKNKVVLKDTKAIKRQIKMVLRRNDFEASEEKLRQEINWDRYSLSQDSLYSIRADWELKEIIEVQDGIWIWKGGGTMYGERI